METRFIIILLPILTLSSIAKETFAENSTQQFVQSLIEHVLLNNFTQEGPVVVLLSNNTQEDRLASLNAVQSPQTIEWLQDKSFDVMSKSSLWPILVHDIEHEDYSLDIPPKGYIIFTNPEMEDFKYNFIQNVENLKNTPYWNPRSNLIVFACGKLQKPPADFAHTVLSALKETSNIINAVLFIFTGDTEQINSYSNGSTTNSIIIENTKAIHAYTLSPYLNGACNEDVIVLIGKWTAHNTSQDNFKSIDLFPDKVPKRFTGCVLNITAFGIEPYLIVKTYKTDDGENKFTLEGISMELINLFTREVNLTPNFLEPVTELKYELLIELVALYTTGIIDIVAGLIPTVQFIKSHADLSVPVLTDTLKYVVPCPKPMKKTEEILTLFSISTWISMGLVFIIVSVLFWMLSNYPTRRNDFTGFNVLTQSFSAAWAVLLGISVPQMPLSLGTRNLFIIYVWYCFAINTVFQAYFTTYLVEPGYEPHLKTLDDVLQAELKLGSYNLMETLRGTVDLNELDDFEEIICIDIDQCHKSVLFNRDTFSFALSYFPTYLASLAGISDQSKVVCFLDNSVITLSMAAVLPIGHPLLKNLNVHIIRCVEAGLLEGYWSKIKHEVNLKANNTDKASEYVVFSLTHLSPVFMLLLFGCILSALLLGSELAVFWIKSNKCPINRSNSKCSLNTDPSIQERSNKSKLIM
ncbi:hypothetical protein L9F63_003989 [Diploptera punctata]|uniref:Ionotropic glutamate receptor C-terminal domain-containing protein n=1 Tax=Diploptera punctata TaxID=6984 RepID=A0AAD7ZGL3_DIPPU|nr:hypothetical protein L9F63_003989 [Diploptera punctata]